MVFYGRLALLATLLCASGCARLAVKIDILDPAYTRDVRAELYHLNLIRSAAAKDHTPVDTAIAEICDAYKEGRLKIYDAYIRRTDEFLAVFDKPMPNFYDAFEDTKKSRNTIAEAPSSRKCVVSEKGFIDRDALLTHYETIGCPVGNCVEVGPKDGALRDARLSGISAYQALLAWYTQLVDQRLLKRQRDLRLNIPTTSISISTSTAELKKVEKLNDELDEEQTAIRKAAVGAADAAVGRHGHLGSNGRTLVLDEVAYAAAKAPRDEWENKFNRVRGLGLGGSTDMVIKLNSTADFSLKGLVFDARATAITARKLTVSSLQLLAAGNGLPIKVEGEKIKGEALPSTEIADANTGLASARANIEADAVAKRHYRAALRRIAASTLAAADAIGKAPATGREAAIKAARARAAGAFAANKPLLEAQTME